MSDIKVPIYWYAPPGFDVEFGWNIGDALKLLADREPVERDITEWISKLHLATIDEAHWPTADLSKPVIVAPIPELGEDWLIDGWHRVRRAAEEGKSTLMVHTLSKEESASVRPYPEEPWTRPS